MNEYLPMTEKELGQIVNKDEIGELTDYEKILCDKRILQKNVKAKINFSKPILILNDKPLIYPRTITVIQGKSGTHKSRLAEHICSVLLRNNDYEADLLGMKSNERNHLICYVDTERNLSEQFPYAIQQIKINSGYDISSDVNNLDTVSLIRIDRTNRFKELRNYLEKNLRQAYNGHIFVVLDVLTDLVENFNDPRDSMRLIDLLNSAINTYDVTFLCIIHENPFQDKARGHLGTELLNKSSTALSINFEKDKNGNELEILKIQFLKSRTGKKFEPLYVKYSENRNRLVYAESDEIEKAISMKDKKANLFDIAKFLIDNLKGEIPKQELIEKLEQEFQCKSRTIAERLKDLLNGKVIHTLGYELINSKRGNKVFFNIKTKKQQPETPSNSKD